MRNTDFINKKGEKVDFTRFINSKDIMDYHRKIGYEYNSLEAAWLVSQCYSITLKERHEAWQWIIDNMPDLNMKERMRLTHDRTLHEYINAFMEMQKQFIREMKEGGKDIVYNCEFLYENECGRDHYYYKAVFPSWDSCIEFIRNHAENEDIAARVRALTIGETREFSNNSYVEVTPDGEIKNAEVYLEEEPEGFDYLEHFFEDQWLEFPVPFKKGDIVCISEEGWSTMGPVVLEDINITDWEHGDKRIEVSRKHGCDTTDMCLWGEFVVESDRFTSVDSDVFWNYMDAEYCNDLTGVNKCLKPISAFMKGEIRIEILLDAYQHLLTKELCGRRKKQLDSYIKEAQEAAGVL